MKFAKISVAASLLISVAALAQIASPSVRLSQDYGAATDLRTFTMDAKSRVREGGVFYAKYVANLCSKDFNAIAERARTAVARQIQQTSTVESWRLTQVDALARRCAGFAPGEAQTLARELSGMPAASDPLANASNSLRAAAKTGRSDLIRAAMESAMAVDDSLLWTSDRLWDAVAQADPEARKRSGFYLGGKVYSESDGPQHLEAATALELGFCKPGSLCAADDEVLLICAAGGDCARDRTEKAKSFYFANGGTEEGWKRILALTAQVRAAIASRNVAFFVR
jgi:hypothetical protein